MAQAEVHYYDHRNGARIVGHGDVWHGEFWWKTGNGSCDMNRTLMMGYPDEKIIQSTQMINLITIEKIVCQGKVVYQETIHELPPLVVSLLVVLDKIETLRAEEGRTAETLREQEAEILKMPEAAVLLADGNTACRFRKTMAAAATLSQLKAEDSAPEDVEYATDQFDLVLVDLVKFADQLCSPYTEQR